MQEPEGQRLPIFLDERKPQLVVEMRRWREHGLGRAIVLTDPKTRNQLHGGHILPVGGESYLIFLANGFSMTVAPDPYAHPDSLSRQEFDEIFLNGAGDYKLNVSSLEEARIQLINKQHFTYIITARSDRKETHLELQHAFKIAVEEAERQKRERDSEQEEMTVWTINLMEGLRARRLHSSDLPSE